MKNTLRRILLIAICFVITAGSVGLTFLLPDSGEAVERPLPEQVTKPSYERVDVLKVDERNNKIAILVSSEVPEYLDSLKKELEVFGFSPDVIDWESAEKMESLFGNEGYDTVIYTDASKTTSTLAQKVRSYVSSGGNLICIGGPAFSHIYEKVGDKYRYLESMPGTNGVNKENESDAIVKLDCLAPAYETFPITNAKNIVSSADQVMIDESSYPIPADIFSPSPRNYATGILNDRTRRFIPLIEALDEKGEIAGYPAYIMLLSCFSENNEVLGRKGSAYASFCTNDTVFIREKKVLNDIATVAAYMNSGTYLYGGGADEYAYFEGDIWNVGAEVISREGVFGIGGAGNYSVSVSIEQDGKELYEKSYLAYEFLDEYDVPYGRKAFFMEDWRTDRSGSFTATAELLKDDVVIDRLSHEVIIYSIKPEDERSYVQSVGNDFYLDGEIWKAYGVNYMPSSGISLTGDEYEKWLSDVAFAPEVVEKDLRRIRDIGFNAISSFIYYDANYDNNNLVYLISLCEKYGLKLFLSIREHMEPMYYTESSRLKFTQLIKEQRLADIDTIIGYDIAWETMPTSTPSWCNRIGMEKFQKEWNEWIIDNYGSISAAEEAWGYTLDKTPNGEARVIVNLKNVNDGNRTAIVAYRRWVADISSEIFGRVVDDLYDIDDNHVVSCRMGMYTGWPNAREVNVGWEYSALAAALDCMGPEGYGYYSTWEDDFEGALFSVLYSRYSCENPVVWFEFGKDAWSGTNYGAAESDQIALQGEYFKLINRMLTESQSNGIFYWWYAGGYRNGEASDYGIINPDGSDRPSTVVIREYASQFLNGKAVELSSNPDKSKADAIGYGAKGLYDVFRDNMRKTMSKGEVYGIVDSAEGTTSLDTSLEKLSKLNNGPVRNLNSDFRRVYYCTESDGEWKLLEEYGTITVKRNEKVYIKANVVNTGIAKWICGKNAGSANGAVGVTLGYNTFALSEDVVKHDMICVEGIEFSVSTGKNMRMQMTADGRCDFGEIFKFTVQVTD